MPKIDSETKYLFNICINLKDSKFPNYKTKEVFSYQ